MFSRLVASTGRSWANASILGGLTAGAVTATGVTVCASGAEQLGTQHLHWPHAGVMDAYDTAAVRRGYEVYRQVCSTCHSLELINFRNLVGVSHTEEQAKALAGSFEIQDGPNDEGEMFDRPGKLSDALPSPYASAEAGRAANNGALPPDLSCISKARHGGPDYIFHLLTGYGRPLPAGLVQPAGTHAH
jgi:ubiquinol-cytochrome c reductase cytochrome c1 subunit